MQSFLSKMTINICTKIRRCGVLANETPLHNIQNDTEIHKYMSQSRSVVYLSINNIDPRKQKAPDLFKKHVYNKSDKSCLRSWEILDVSRDSNIYALLNCDFGFVHFAVFCVCLCWFFFFISSVFSGSVSFIFLHIMFSFPSYRSLFAYWFSLHYGIAKIVGIIISVL